MQARKFYLDTQSRSFVSSPTSTLAPANSIFFDEDVESIELYFLQPTGLPERPYEYLDYSANTVKFAVGATAPAALQITWSPITSSVIATITSLVTGGSGSNEQQQITIAPKPASGGWAIQFPSRNITVSSVSAGVFTAADHGLYPGQSVSLTAFSFTSNSAVANGSSYFVLRNSKDTFSLASTASSATALSAAVTSGGGTVTLPAVTTGQLAYNAGPTDVQAAFVASGLTINNQPQITVTGTAGEKYVLTYGNGSANRDYANVTVVGSTLVGPFGLLANVSFATSEVAALVASGNSSVKLEVEVAGGGRRQTYQSPATLSADIISSSSPPPIAPASSFSLTDGAGGTWSISIDSSGVLTATKQ